MGGERVSEIEEIKGKKEKAIKNQDFEGAAQMRDQEKQAKEKLETLLTNWRKAGEEKRIVVRFQSVAPREGDALRVDYFRGAGRGPSTVQDGGAYTEVAVGGVGVLGDGDGALLQVCGLRG